MLLKIFLITLCTTLTHNNPFNNSLNNSFNSSENIFNPINSINSINPINPINNYKVIINNYTLNKIKIFLYKLNDGKRLIYDMCEILDETYSIVSGSNKPDCQYNISYINSDNIHVFKIKNEIRTFFLNERKNFCSKQQIECGELTIIIKLLDILNSGIDLAITNNINFLWINLEIINFDELYNLYKKSLVNNEILTNITLSKTKANIILEQEKNRLKILLNKNWMDKYTNYIYIYIGDPINNSIGYIANSFSSTIEKAIPNISIELKIIFVLLLLLFIKRS